jgi:hypothetical protein
MSDSVVVRSLYVKLAEIPLEKRSEKLVWLKTVNGPAAKYF